MTPVEKLILESTLESLEERIEEVALAAADTEFDIDEIKQDFERLKEDLSAGDWGRFGIITGVLWNKLDSMLTAIKDSNRSLQDIVKNTSRK